MNNIFNLIDEMESYFDTCKKVPISNKLMVDIEIIYEFMSDLRVKLPEEIKRAERIVEDRDKIIKEANQSAVQAQKEAQLRVEQLVNEHEIIQKALVEAEQIVEESKSTAQEIKASAYEYVDELIVQLESAVRETLEDTNQQYQRYEDYMRRQMTALEQNRQELNVRKTGKKR